MLRITNGHVVAAVAAFVRKSRRFLGVVSGKRTRAMLARCISIFIAASLVVSSTAEGLFAASTSFTDMMAQLRQRSGLSERPTPVFKGSNPKRDPVFRAGRWNPRTLADLQAVRTAQMIEAGEFDSPSSPFFASNLVEVLNALQAAPPGGGGGEGGGEGSGGGGGKGGIGGATSTTNC